MDETIEDVTKEDETKNDEKMAVDQEKFKSVSALKQIIGDFLIKKQPKTCLLELDFTSNNLVLEIYETFPYLLCHDGYFFIQVCIS